MNHRKISVEEAAKRMGKNPQYVRYGLQQGRLPFGSAVKTGEKNWDYQISEDALEAYLSGSIMLKEIFNKETLKEILED